MGNHSNKKGEKMKKFTIEAQLTEDTNPQGSEIIRETDDIFLTIFLGKKAARSVLRKKEHGFNQGQREILTDVIDSLESALCLLRELQRDFKE